MVSFLHNFPYNMRKTGAMNWTPTIRAMNCGIDANLPLTKRELVEYSYKGSERLVVFDICVITTS